MPIPRIQHRIWLKFGENGSSVPPAEYTPLVQSWLEKHPTWTHMFWNDENSRKFMTTHYPWAVEMFYNYTKPIFRVDVLRYFLLSHYGGFYVDYDTRCFQSLDSLCENQVVLVRDPNPVFLNNGFMGAEPNHPFMKQCCDNLKYTANSQNIMLATGPLFLGGNWLLAKNKHEIKILKLGELKYYLHHYFHSTWTGISKWKQALDKDRRKFMKPEEIPCMLRPFLKGTKGQIMV